jgi:excisionase family DNA binding protein
MKDEMLKLTEIAALLNCAPSTPWRWVKRGWLPAVQTGSGMIRVRRADLEAFVSKSPAKDVKSAGDAD